ncbi:hypothetical protein [Paenibacillus dendritiformis]|uniref:hypothetical protein n=1 Tax=Paenibacillus dendritiformis TaxID=130049 RepID=UPI000DAA8D80|nr:hypothetical protein [Paenibacillus dendritiformis]PZM63716.1 hypothetical protein DOE73_20530 [Paenibacillus dendritiformis]
MYPIDYVKLMNHIEKEKKKHQLWAFLAQHGGRTNSYSHGYLLALKEIEEAINDGKFDLAHGSNRNE